MVISDPIAMQPSISFKVPYNHKNIIQGSHPDRRGLKSRLKHVNWPLAHGPFGFTAMGVDDRNVD